MKRIRLFIFLILALSFSVMFISCNHKTNAWDTLDKVEEVINSQPDSALTILSSIDKYSLGDGEEKARYALLMSMALDKNYIDTTTFDVIQPAIDYYLQRGTNDEKLRTWFYQGRIFQNQEDYDNAMQSFLKAADLKNYQDTLTYANMLIAQGNLYFRSYQLDDYISNNLKAATFFAQIGNKRYQQVGLIKALDGCVTLNYKDRADSILSKVEALAVELPEFQQSLSAVKLTHTIRFGSESKIKTLLDSLYIIDSQDDEIKLNLALGYFNIKEYNKARELIESIDTTGNIGASIKYLHIKPKIHEANHQYKDAIDDLNAYFLACDALNRKVFYQKTTVAEEHYQLTIQNLYELRRKDKLLWLGICVLLALIIIIGIVFYKLRIDKLKRIVNEKERARLQLENENLQKQNSVLEIEKYNSELEQEKRRLAAENMQLRIIQLEAEDERLKELLKQAELSKPILDSIQERIGIVNALLAAKITNNEDYSKPYDKWINQVTEDRKEFTEKTRLAFRASHPAFMKYLDEHGLTETELNYVCLYAIGLRGKEVGEYIQLKRHYHISTDIRKKLGMNEDDTNLGIHIRKLMKKL